MTDLIEKQLLTRFNKNSRVSKLYVRLTKRDISISPIEGVIKVRLDKRWDTFPDPDGKRKSFFGGREEDVKKLKNWLIYSDGGSLLIKGFRGIGKTAFVYFAISEARNLLSYFGIKKGRKKKNLLFIPVNFSGDLNDNNDISNEVAVLTRIIVSLKLRYKNLKGIDKLYKVAISSQAQQEEEHSKSRIFVIQFTQKIALTIVGVISLYFIQAFLSETFPELANTLNRFGLSFISRILYDTRLPLVITGLFLLRLTWEFKKNEKKVTKILLKNPNYLSLELKEILDNSRLIPVFVVDELDKLFKTDKGAGRNGVTEINNIIRKLKYLFNLSRARFIFIVHEEYPNWKELNLKGRPEESTYFNWDIFLSGLTLSEIKLYFDKVIQNQLSFEGDDLRDDFVNYISFKSKRVFSEINQLLRDNIIYEDGIPYLLIKDFRGSGSSGLNKMRLAVIEDILDTVLTQEEGLEDTLSQREFVHKSYRILRKAADDVVQNRFGGDLSDKNIKMLTELYSSERKSVDDTLNPDFICPLLPNEVNQMNLKLKDFFIAMQKSAFTQPDEGLRVFFDENNSIESPINASLTFEDIDTSGRPSRAQIKRLPSESYEFKNYVNKINSVLQDLKQGLKSEDIINVATSVYGDDGVAMLAAISTANKITEDDYKTHNLDAVRKFNHENPNFYKIIDLDPLERFKNWLSYNLFGSKSEDILIRGRKVGFKFSIGKTTIFIFHQTYTGRIPQQLQRDLKKGLIILLNNATINLNIKTYFKLSVDLSNLDGANKILETINKKILKKNTKNKINLISGKQEQHFASFIDIKEKPGKSLISSVIFNMQSESDYWRIGLLLGQNSSDDYEPLGNLGFPLIHLHKDAGDPQLRLTTYANGKHPPDISGRDLKMPATGVITVRLSLSPNNIIRLFVNDKPVYNALVDLQFLNKASIVAWGDGNPEFKGVQILSYSFDEIA
jgi:hypothetical protein